jgi:hypothetical protein
MLGYLRVVRRWPLWARVAMAAGGLILVFLFQIPLETEVPGETLTQPTPTGHRDASRGVPTVTSDCDSDGGTVCTRRRSNRGTVCNRSRSYSSGDASARAPGNAHGRHASCNRGGAGKGCHAHGHDDGGAGGTHRHGHRAPVARSRLGPERLTGAAQLGQLLRQAPGQDQRPLPIAPLCTAQVSSLRAYSLPFPCPAERQIGPASGFLQAASRVVTSGQVKPA